MDSFLNSLLQVFGSWKRICVEYTVDSYQLHGNYPHLHFSPGGFIRWLVEAPIQHDSFQIFLIVYPCFVDDFTIIKLIRQEFLILPFLEPNGNELKVRKLRLVALLKKLMHGFERILEKEKILMKTIELIEPKLNEMLTKTFKHLSRTDRQNYLSMVFIEPPPASIIPTELNLEHIHPLEMARQLTLTMWEKYFAIRGHELVNWNFKKDPKTFPNLHAFITFSSALSKYVHKSIETNKATMTFWADVAVNLNQLQNFHALDSILSSIDDSEALSNLTAFQELKNLVSPQNSYQNLRTTLHTCSPPCIPYLGIFFRDLQMIGDTLYDLHGLLNFRVLELAWSPVRELLCYQSQPYNFSRLDPIQHFLEEEMKELASTE